MLLPPGFLGQLFHPLFGIPWGRNKQELNPPSHLVLPREMLSLAVSVTVGERLALELVAIRVRPPGPVVME